MINSYFEKILAFSSNFLGNFNLNVSAIKIDSNSKPALLLLLLLLLAILVIAFIVDKLLINSVLGAKYRLFVAPGVILHEIAHALLCVLTGAKIKGISLFDKEGGSVQHEQSRIPVLGPVLISLAPFVAGVLAIYYLSGLLGIKGNELLVIDYNNQAIVDHFQRLFRNIDFSNYKNLVILYLALSVVVTMTPSKQDLKNMAIPGIACFSLVILAFYFKLSFINFSHLPIDRLLIFLSPILMLLILALVLSIIIFALSKIFKR